MTFPASITRENTAHCRAHPWPPPITSRTFRPRLFPLDKIVPALSCLRKSARHPIAVCPSGDNKSSEIHLWRSVHAPPSAPQTGCRKIPFRTTPRLKISALSGRHPALFARPLPSHAPPPSPPRRLIPHP